MNKSGKPSFVYPDAAAGVLCTESMVDALRRQLASWDTPQIQFGSARNTSIRLLWKASVFADGALTAARLGDPLVMGAIIRPAHEIFQNLAFIGLTDEDDGEFHDSLYKAFGLTECYFHLSKYASTTGDARELRTRGVIRSQAELHVRDFKEEYGKRFWGPKGAPQTILDAMKDIRRTFKRARDEYIRSDGMSSRIASLGEALCLPSDFVLKEDILDILSARRGRDSGQSYAAGSMLLHMNYAALVFSSLDPVSEIREVLRKLNWVLFVSSLITWGKWFSDTDFSEKLLMAQIGTVGDRLAQNGRTRGLN